MTGGAVHRSWQRHNVAFWVTACAFFLNMGFSAVPTPLYALYQARDHFSDAVVTVVYAMFAFGVMATLYLAGPVSDWAGRRVVLVSALLVNVASAVLFVLAPSLPGLLVARLLSGVSVGLTTATATAYLGELDAVRTRAARLRVEVVAGVANLGGIGFGPLAAGALARFAPWPLVLPYVVFGAAAVALAAAVHRSPETVLRARPRPAYRPQRLVVPAARRRLYCYATLAGLSSFTIYGIMNTLVPAVLVDVLHTTSRLLAGALVFSAFAGGALAQIVQARVDNVRLLRRSVPVVFLGLALLAAGVSSRQAAVCVAGGILCGTGAGMTFKAALVLVGAEAGEDTRAEVLAGFFLGSYVGLSVPVIGFGIATASSSVPHVLFAFGVLAALAVGGTVSGCLANVRRDPTRTKVTLATSDER